MRRHLLHVLATPAILVLLGSTPSSAAVHPIPDNCTIYCAMVAVDRCLNTTPEFCSGLIAGCLASCKLF
jgi:hypothetical protein